MADPQLINDGPGNRKLVSLDPQSKQRPQSLWHLGGLSWWNLTKQAWCEIGKDDLDNRAYELAYNFLVAAFPLLLFLIALFSLFAGKSVALRAGLFEFLAQVIPPLAYDLLANTVDEIIKTGGSGKLTVGLVLALIAGSSGTTQLMWTLNVAYQLRETRSWIKVHLISLALTLVILLLVFGALLLVLAGGYVAEVLGQRMGMSSLFVAGWKALEAVMSVAFVLLAYAVVYYFAPNHQTRRWHWISPGSVVGVGLWLLASAGLRFYLHFSGSYSTAYGSLGGVIILLLWFYVTGFAFLVGGEVNSVIEHADVRSAARKERSNAA
jgi:membrane protein